MVVMAVLLLVLVMPAAYAILEELGFVEPDAGVAAEISP